MSYDSDLIVGFSFNQISMENHSFVLDDCEMGVKDFQGKPYPSCGFTAVFVMAHEIGHNLANGHDSGSCALANKKHVMQLGWSLYNWSQCARRNFIMLYLQLKRADNWCLDGKL